jgi:hypothetical protein
MILVCYGWALVCALENFLRINITAGFLDQLPKSYVIVFGLGPFDIRVFSLYFINFCENKSVFHQINSKIQMIQRYNYWEHPRIQ